jgi:hypothetical protein
MDAPTNAPNADDLEAIVAKCFRGSGWGYEAAWIEWWPEARFCRVVLEPQKKRPNPVTALERAWRLRKQLVRMTGVPWTVCLYEPGITQEDKESIIGNAATQFGSY